MLINGYYGIVMQNLVAFIRQISFFFAKLPDYVA